MAYNQSGYGYGTSFSFMLTPMVKRLMIANAVVFAVTLLVGQPFMVEWFAFQPREIFFRPWGVVTYMFVHGDLMHLAVNMLVLFFFGPPLEARWGEREFLKFYLICGLGGVALSYLFLPVAVIGASAAGYGIMIGFALNWPNAPIYIWGIFPVKAKYLVTFFFVLAFLSAVQGTGGGVAHFAHLGGLISGFLYLKADWRPTRSLQRFRSAAKKTRRMAIVPRGDEAESDEASSSPKPAREDPALYDRVDAVLDKISAEGMSSLTPAELELLDRVSKKHRSN